MLSATTLVVATMIGTGVFTTSGFTLADLQSPWLVLTAWVLGGIIATLGALSYGALARRLPESGGEYLFLSRTLHPAAGYIAGWISFFAGFSAPLAASAIAFGQHSRAWWPDLPQLWTATALVVACAALHAVSVRRGMWLHNAAVLLKLLVIAIFIATAASHFPGRDPLPPTPSPHASFPWTAFAVSLIWISFSYAGWNAAVYVGGEVRQPERNLPRALLLGTGLVTAIYLALNAVFVFSAPVPELAGQLDIGVVSARALGGETLAQFVAGLISLVLIAHISGMTMAGPRVYARMAADGYLPRVLAPVEGPPRVAILLQTVATLIMLWLAAYDRLLTYIGFTLSLSTAATVAGLMILRRREGPSFRVPGWPWVPSLFLVLTLAVAAFSALRRPGESLAGLAVLAFGWAAWALTRRRTAPPTP
ncbi:MAG: amino acid permease [Verrucomicrobiae bacterium]|nr:amino acid permease [Verrucomicrobiae bacterium]